MGDMGHNALTEYQTVSAAYRDPYVSIRLDERHIEIMTPDVNLRVKTSRTTKVSSLLGRGGSPMCRDGSHRVC